MPFSFLVRALLTPMVCVSFAATNAQERLSPQQRLSSVESHLTRYVILKNSDHAYMRLQAEMERLRVPAVSIAAIRSGRIDWAQAYGVISVGGERATTRTLFSAASISKPLTAVGVLKLVEEGRVDLDAQANHYLKRWKTPDNAFTSDKKVTVRELLNHTSGIGTHNGALYDPTHAIPTLVQLLNGAPPAKTPPVRVEAIPGTKWAYSNGGYLVLQLLVEDVTGEAFATYIKHTVLDPIGMNDSTFDSPLSPVWASRAATGYWDDGKSGVPPTQFVEPNLAAGGLWSTPTDLAKFLIEMQREYQGTSHKVLHQPTVQLLSKPGLGGWGLGFRVQGGPENSVLRHEGSAAFQDDMLIYLHGNGFVVMTIGGGGTALANELVRSAGIVYDFPDFRPLERAAIDVSPAILSRYPGVYAYVKVAMAGDRLTAEIPEGSRPQLLFAESPTHFFVLDGPQELQFDLDGNTVDGVEFITPMGRHALKRSEEDRK